MPKDRDTSIRGGDRGSAYLNGGLPPKMDVEVGLPGHAGTRRGLRGFALSVGAISALCLILISIFGEYPEGLGDRHVAQYYHYLTGVLIMVFVGFGFLMTFLRRYALSAVGLNFGLSAMMMIGAVICMGWAHSGFGTFEIDLPLLVDAAFCAAAGMISFGAVIGFTSPTQLAWLLAIEVPIYAANFVLVTKVIGSFDIGGSITIHAFGAFYGLAASFFLSRSSATRGSAHPKNRPSYTSDVTSMIGTIFLWVYWPSFNAALASVGEGSEALAGPQHQIYVIMNTLISLLGACLATFIVSAALNDSIDMVHVQNATLAGGVAIGTAAALKVAPGAVFGVGLIAGTLSTLGFSYSTAFFESKLGLSDTCGVQNLHGMPGIMGGIVSAIFTAIWYDDNSSILDKAMSGQAGLQIAGLAATLGVAIVSGLAVGFITSREWVPALAVNTWFEDESQDDLYEDAAVWKEVEKED